MLEQNIYSAESILEKFKECEVDAEVKPLIEAFRLLPVCDRQSVEKTIIDILENETNGEVPRSWTPTLLGAVGSDSAKQYLINRLKTEKNDLFRRWITTVLIRYFDGDERIEAIINQIACEKTASNQHYMINALIEARNPLCVDTFLDGLKYTEGDYATNIRISSVKGLKSLALRKSVMALVMHLSSEPELSIKLEIIEALIAINDNTVVPALIKLLEDQLQPMQFHIVILQALGKLGNPQNTAFTNAIVNATCNANRITAFTATDTLLQLLSKSDAAKQLVEFGLKQTTSEALVRVADALRVVDCDGAIPLLKNANSSIEQENRSRFLLEQVGGHAAINVLLQRKIETLNQAKERVKSFDEQALKIFNNTVSEPRKAFTISLIMSIVIFAIGVILLGVSIYLIVLPNSSSAQQLFGVGGTITGMSSILAMFYKGPMERIEKSVAHLIQIEVAFLGYIRQVTQTSAVFEREYLDNDGFNVDDLKNILSCIERSVKEIMPLINKYSTTQTPIDANKEPLKP